VHVLVHEHACTCACTSSVAIRVYAQMCIVHGISLQGRLKSRKWRFQIDLRERFQVRKEPGLGSVTGLGHNFCSKDLETLLTIIDVMK
jgi:hypothetical protein